MTDLELTPVEFAALLERVGPEQRAQAVTPKHTPDGSMQRYPTSRNTFTLDPVTFWVETED